MNTTFIKIMAGVLAVVVALLLFFLYFDEDFLPQFPYKYVNLKEKSATLDSVEMNITTVKKQVEDWKNKIEVFNENAENESPIINPSTDVIVKKMPKAVDYPSLLLFIEEQALLNDVIVSDINLNRAIDKENLEVPETTEPSTGEGAEQSTEPTTEPMTEVVHQNNLEQYGVEQQTVFFTIMGDYLKIEEFIQSLNNDVGIYNFIERVNLVRGSSEVIDWEKFKEEVQIVIPNEPGADETEEATENFEVDSEKEIKNINKNILVEIKLVLNFKSGGN